MGAAEQRPLMGTVIRAENEAIHAVQGSWCHSQDRSLRQGPLLVLP